MRHVPVASRVSCQVVRSVRGVLVTTRPDARATSQSSLKTQVCTVAALADPDTEVTTSRHCDGVTTCQRYVALKARNAGIDRAANSGVSNAASRSRSGAPVAVGEAPMLMSTHWLTRSRALVASSDVGAAGDAGAEPAPAPSPRLDIVGDVVVDGPLAAGPAGVDDAVVVGEELAVDNAAADDELVELGAGEPASGRSPPVVGLCRSGRSARRAAIGSAEASRAGECFESSIHPPTFTPTSAAISTPTAAKNHLGDGGSLLGRSFTATPGRSATLAGAR